MSYEVKYTDPRHARLEKAYQDAFDYINKPDWFVKLLPHIKEIWYMKTTITDKKQLIKSTRMWLSFAGLQGLSVTAILRMAIYGKVKKPRKGSTFH